MLKRARLLRSSLDPYGRTANLYFIAGGDLPLWQLLARIKKSRLSRTERMVERRLPRTMVKAKMSASVSDHSVL
jgi:hypothetical protein